MMSDLSKKTCTPCHGGVPPLKGNDLLPFHAQLQEGWQIIEEHHLQRTFLFLDFREALSFTNRVGELSEKESHHPDLHLSWGKVVVEIWTHKIGGLTENDFILASKVDALFCV